jgi:hypothetical protein
LHGLHIVSLKSVREAKLKLLHHLINGDCFAPRCEKSSPAPDRTACLCVGGAFASSLAITTFIVQLLKSSTSTTLCTEDLLTIVESVGVQSPYEHSFHLRRRLFATLDDIHQLCKRRAQRNAAQEVIDPYGDLFMGFEEKRRPTLQSIMEHHGLQVSTAEKKLTNEEMREQIISHIVNGRCADSPQTTAPPFRMRHAEEANTVETGCEDFVRDADGNEQGTEIALLRMAVNKIGSRKTLLRFMECNNIDHDPSHSLKQLRHILK